MTQEEKYFLLFQDLCARFPYGVKLHIPSFSDTPQLLQQISDYGTVTINDYECPLSIDKVKPYLRSMSSMTEEELIESLEFAWTDDYGRLASYGGNIPKYIDWLNKNKFDYRGLIPNNLAIEVTKENNPY